MNRCRQVVTTPAEEIAVAPDFMKHYLTFSKRICGRPSEADQMCASCKVNQTEVKSSIERLMQKLNGTKE